MSEVRVLPGALNLLFVTPGAIIPKFMENMDNPAIREQAMVLGRFRLKLAAVLEDGREEYHLSESEMHDLMHSFMLAAGSNVGGMVAVHRGKQALIATVREGLEQAGESMTYEPGHEVDIADAILAPQGVSLDQMRAFYVQQERAIITRGLEAQAAGSTAHPIIQGVLGHLYPQKG